MFASGIFFEYCAVFEIATAEFYNVFDIHTAGMKDIAVFKRIFDKGTKPFRIPGCFSFSVPHLHRASTGFLYNPMKRSAAETISRPDRFILEKYMPDLGHEKIFFYQIISGGYTHV